MPDKREVMDIEILSRGALETAEGDAGIKRVVVLGAGTMGCGITQLIASKGMDVILIERTDEGAKDGLKNMESNRKFG